MRRLSRLQCQYQGLIYQRHGYDQSSDRRRGGPVSLEKAPIYQSPELLIVDEIGYLSLGQQGSHLFFQVISARHQKIHPVDYQFALRRLGKGVRLTTVATAIPTVSYTAQRFSSWREQAIEEKRND